MTGTIDILNTGQGHMTLAFDLKDLDGNGDLEPDVPYRLNEYGEFVRARQ